MKKQKIIKKKAHKIEREQRNVAPAAVIAESDTEILELAPQQPLGGHCQVECHGDVHKE